MTYANAQDMIDRFGGEEMIQLTDRSNTGVVQTAVLAPALTDADAEIDAALAARYALPLAAVPPLLVGIACDLARYRLYTNAVPERVQSAADNARKLLRQLAAGDYSLGLPAVSEPSTAAQPRCAAPAAVFDAQWGF